MIGSPEIGIGFGTQGQSTSLEIRSLSSPVTQRFAVESTLEQNDLILPELFASLDQRHRRSDEKLPQISPGDIEILLGYPQVEERRIDLPQMVEQASISSLIRLTNSIRSAAAQGVLPGDHFPNKLEGIAVDSMYQNFHTPKSDEEAVDVASKIWTKLREMYVFVGRKPNTKLSIEGWAASSKSVKDIWFDEKTESSEEEVKRLLVAEARKNDNIVSTKGAFDDLSFEVQPWLSASLNADSQTILNTELGTLPIATMIDAQFSYGGRSIIISTHIGRPDRLLLWPARVKGLLRQIAASSAGDRGMYTNWNPQKIVSHHHLYKVYDPRHHLPYLVSTDPINQQEANELVDRFETAVILLATETKHFKELKRRRKSAVVLPHFPKTVEGDHVQPRLF